MASGGAAEPVAGVPAATQRPPAPARLLLQSAQQPLGTTRGQVTDLEAWEAAPWANPRVSEGSGLLLSTPGTEQGHQGKASQPWPCNLCRRDAAHPSPPQLRGGSLGTPESVAELLCVPAHHTGPERRPGLTAGLPLPQGWDWWPWANLEEESCWRSGGWPRAGSDTPICRLLCFAGACP